MNSCGIYWREGCACMAGQEDGKELFFSALQTATETVLFISPALTAALQCSATYSSSLTGTWQSTRISGGWSLERAVCSISGSRLPSGSCVPAWFDGVEQDLRASLPAWRQRLLRWIYKMPSSAQHSLWCEEPLLLALACMTQDCS